MNIKILLFKTCYSGVRPLGELKSILNKSFQSSGGKSDYEYFAATYLTSVTAWFTQKRTKEIRYK